MGLAPGLRATVRLIVTDTDTAAQIGSGDVSVLATPRLLALAEAAAVAAITPNLEPGLTSVGTAVSMEHKRASPVGAEVVVEAELTEVEGRRLVFSFIAWQAPRDDSGGTSGAPTGSTAARSETTSGSETASGGTAATGSATAGGAEDDDQSVVVGAGTVERVVVDRERFVAGARR